MYPQKYFTLNFLSMKYFLLKNFRTRVLLVTDYNYVCSHSPLPCNCYNKSLCSDKHVQITLLIGNVQKQL